MKYSSDTSSDRTSYLPICSTFMVLMIGYIRERRLVPICCCLHQRNVEIHYYINTVDLWTGLLWPVIKCGKLRRIRKCVFSLCEREVSAWLMEQHLSVS